MKSDAIIGALEGVTKKWAKQRKREEREASARTNRRYVLTRRHSISMKMAAWEVMELAYLKASSGGSLPAHARQIMYAARAKIQQLATKPLGKGFDQYFTQTLLPDYISKTGVTWNVVFDARGHFYEPHTDKEVPLGTLEVRDYLRQVAGHVIGDLDFSVWEDRYPTVGPANRYGAILFIENEGFMPLFRQVKLAERYDLAIMSTKGMSVVAARSLVDSICARHIPLLVLHDFDKAGFSIVGTLKRDTRRYQFAHDDIKVTDLGMRLGDIDGLETESVYIESPNAARANLREKGATDDEIDFLLNERVELNAFASDELVAWIEGKLEEQGLEKVIPGNEHLTAAYRRAVEQTFVQERINEVVEEAHKLGIEAKVPTALPATVERCMKEAPATTWDAIVREIAEGDAGDGQ